MPLNCNDKITLSNLCVAVASQQQKSFRIVQQRYGDGYTARRQDGINPVICIWNVSTPPMPVADAEDLQNELIDLGPRFFSWTAPGESEPKNWILDPVEWSVAYPDIGFAVVSFSLRRWYGF